MKKQLLALGVAAALSAGAAQAGTVTVSDSFGFATTNWTDLVNAAQFDTTLGNLNSVTITISGEILQSLKAENTGAVSDVLTPNIGGSFKFRHNGTAIQTLNVTNTGSSFSASAYDGNPDFGGTSGVDFGTLSANNTQTFTLTTGLADFIGTGDLSAYFDVRASGTGFIDTNNGNLDSSVSTQAKYNITLVYDYTSRNVPEPVSLALVSLGLLGVAASRRRAK